jgi:ribosomal-protein-alanine N-acetyltransferase
MNIDVVEMHEHHVDHVCRIENDTSAQPWSANIFLTEINNPTYILLVAQTADGSDVFGFTGGQLIADEFHIHSLAVDQNHRRCHIGTQLMEKLLICARDRAATSATLEVRVHNEAAKNLYHRIGFVEEAIRKNYYADNGEDASIMWLRSLEKVGR